jgi:thiamine biosynthesis protein ThiI
MLLEASRLAEQLGAEGVVTGETLGQVASQTLPNMLLIHSYARLPVYTPLLSLDKHEAGNLVAHEAVKTPRCPFLPRRPVTRPDPALAEMILEEVSVEELARLADFEVVEV